MYSVKAYWKYANLLSWLMPCHFQFQWNIGLRPLGHRPLVSIQPCLVLLHPSSASCTGKICCPHFFLKSLFPVLCSPSSPVVLRCPLRAYKMYLLTVTEPVKQSARSMYISSLRHTMIHSYLDYCNTVYSQHLWTKPSRSLCRTWDRNRISWMSDMVLSMHCPFIIGRSNMFVNSVLVPR